MTKMIENFEIIGSFIKDMSSETADAPTYVFVRENISKYQLNININSKALKNRLIEVDVILKFTDKEESKKKAHFEIVYTTIVKIAEKISDKNDVEKIILCDVPNKIYPELEKIFLNLLASSGYPGIKFDKKIDFVQLYKQRSN
jgi:preprotein translocase subunit SecB